MPGTYGGGTYSTLITPVAGIGFTQSQLVRELARALFPRDLIEGTVYVSPDTNGNTITLPELRASSGSPNLYLGGYLYVYEGLCQGDARRIELYEPTKGASYGSVNVQRPLSSSPDGTTKVLIYNGGRSPDELKLDINNALQRLWRRRYLPITQVDDGLMESSDTTSWSSSNATLSKVTDQNSVFEGVRALRVQNSAPNGYAQSSEVYASDNEPVRVEVVCRINNAANVTTTATLQLIAASTNTVIASVSTTSRDRVRLSLFGNVPGNEGGVVVRLVGTEATADVAWDDLLVWKQNELQLTLPAEITAENQVLGLFRRVTRTGVGPTNTSEPFSTSLIQVHDYDTLTDPVYLGRVAVNVQRSGVTAHPLVVQCLVPYAELSTDTDTVSLPNKLDFLSKAKAFAWQAMSQGGPHDDRSYYDKQAQRGRIGASNASAYGPRGNRDIRR